VIRVAGIDHVGLGSDFDGISKLPAGMEDVSQYPVITELLYRRGYDEAQIHKILYGNLLRVLRQATTPGT
jgi:membrane dipeptidase